MEIRVEHFFSYYMNFIGIFMPPIATFQEYRHFLLEDFPRKDHFNRMNLKQLGLVLLFLVLNVFMPRFWDFDLIQKPEFANFSIPRRIIHVSLNSFLERQRYYIVFVWGNLIGMIANLRESTVQYREY